MDLLDGSRVYYLMRELSDMDAEFGAPLTKQLMNKLKGLLELGERGSENEEDHFRSAILDMYYADFVKEGIRICVVNKCKKIQDSLYYPVLEILFKKYQVHPDITDDHGRTPMYYAKKSKCQPYIDYLKSKGSKMVESSAEDSPKAKSPKESVKKPKKRKKTQKKKAKKCSFRKSTSRCVNGDKQSRKCYRNKSTKRCRKKR